MHDSVCGGTVQCSMPCVWVRAVRAREHACVIMDAHFATFKDTPWD